MTFWYRREGIASTSVSLAINGKTHDNVFLVNWSSLDNLNKICASFTLGISSFVGAPIIRVQFTTNGILGISHDELQDVVASLITAGGQEALQRSWLPSMHDLMPSMRLHALYEPKIVKTLRGLGAQTRFLGPRPMQPTIMEFKKLPEKYFAQALPQPSAFEVRAKQASGTPLFNAQETIGLTPKYESHCVA